MILRPHQMEAVDIGVKFFNQKTCVNSLMVCPTAWGKSLLCACIPKEIEGNTLVITTSAELLEQNYNKMIAFGGEGSIYSASFNTKEFGKTTYATLQSLKNKGSIFKSKGYKNIIFDEAHLASKGDSGMFRKFIEQSGIKKILGLTATPFKLETRTNYVTGEEFAKLEMLTKRGKYKAMYKEIIYLMQIKDLVNQGYWCPLEYEIFNPDSGELIFNTNGAEFTEESIDRFYKNQKLDDKIFNRVMESTSDSILVFVPSVTKALELSSMIPDSAAVWGAMSKSDRKKTLEDFKSKKLRVVINVNVLAVGFDHEELSHIIDGCPSASLAKLYQKYGRGTRIHPNKEKCIITDFVGNINRFGKLESLRFIKTSDGQWNLFSKNRLLTEISIENIKSMVGDERVFTFTKDFQGYGGRMVHKVPFNELQRILETHEWDASSNHIREEILRIKRKMFKNQDV